MTGMTGDFGYPGMDQRMDAVKQAIAWASGATTVWRDQSDGGRVREANEAWLELRPRRIAPIGVDDIRDEERDDATNPRQEVIVSWREIFFELRAMSRSQAHLASGWYAMMRVQTRLKSTYVLERWLKPNCLAVVSIGDVLNMPENRHWDDRQEDLAILEFSTSTALTETDESNVGTWIENAILQGNVHGLAPSMQVVDELVGFGSDVHIVKDGSVEETFVTNNNNLLIKGAP